MRIALLVPGGVDRSGTERVIPCLLWLIEALTRGGHDVQVFAAWQEKRPGKWDLLGARIHNIGRRPRAPFMLAALIAEHRRERFDVVHAFWAQGCGVAGGIAGWLLGIPVVLTLAGGDLEAIPDIGYGGRLGRRGRIEAWIACRLALYVTAPSEQLQRRAAIHRADAIALPLGVAIEHWPPRQPRSRDTAAPIALLHIASLNPVKDQRMLLRAARALVESQQPFELIVIGEDTLDGEIQRLATGLGLDSRVRFLGFLTHAQLRPWVERADLLVMTSRHEAGPLTLLEAAIAGVPTVGTAVGHIADFAPGAATAVPVGDHHALAAEISRLARHEPLRLAIARAAQARALRCDARWTAQRFCELYSHRPKRGVSE